MEVDRGNLLDIKFMMIVVDTYVVLHVGLQIFYENIIFCALIIFQLQCVSEIFETRDDYFHYFEQPDESVGEYGSTLNTRECYFQAHGVLFTL